MDEAYLLPGPEIRNFEDAALYALRIKDEVCKQERITFSAGVEPNKLIAKIASGFQKPDGLTVVRPGDVRDFLYPLEVSKSDPVKIKGSLDMLIGVYIALS